MALQFSDRPFECPPFVSRSPGWARVREEHLKKQPVCAATGSDEDLDVHHIKPVHLFPDLELDPKNLITLCRPLHFWMGHGGSWYDYNPFVVKHAASFHFNCVRNRKRSQLQFPPES